MPIEESFYLVPWHNLVSDHRGSLKAVIRENEYTLDEHDGSEVSADGFYAKYPEGTFIFVCSTKNPIRIGWSGSAISLEDIEKSQWVNGFMGLFFSIITTRKEYISFYYHTIYRAPWRLITDIIFQDDDWLMVCDLPGAVQNFLEDERPSLEMFRDKLKKTELL